MKERISALMDGELDDRSAAALIQALEHDREALESWRLYHLMGDAMRERIGLPRPRPGDDQQRFRACAGRLALPVVQPVECLERAHRVRL